MLKSRKLFKVVALLVTVLMFEATAFTGCSGTPVAKVDGNQPVTINFATAGDANMLEFFKNTVSPDFKVKYPNITVNVVGTGAGDAGSRDIYTKLKAQKDAGTVKWDIDAAVVHQSIMSDMMKEQLLTKYVGNSANKALVTAANTKNSLGTDVEGYVIPLFNSQTVIAYNPKMVTNVPKTFDDVVKWIKDNPKKFGYNGVTGGMSGVGFAAAYMYYKTGKYDLFSKGPYDIANESTWPDIMKELKALPVTYTQANAGTLDMLNRGEIAMGPVWVDMLGLWKTEGRMDPGIGIILPTPGMPGQPMYLVISAKAANADAALKYIDFLSSPEIQAKYVVEKNNWYPGVDANTVFAKCSDATKNRLFGTVTAADLAKNGLSFPLAPYLADVIKTYTEAK